jgi:hypothetical protein
MLPDEGRRWSSLWMPAFMAAVAASECGEAAILRDAEGDWLREVPLEADGDCSGEGGSVFKSGGAMERGGVKFGHLEIQYAMERGGRTACDRCSLRSRMR